MENFDLETKTDGKQIIDFWANWCNPCRMLAPIFQEMSEEKYLLERGFKFYKTNIDENSEVAEKWVVRSIPTLLVLKDGVEIDRIIGVQPKQKLIERLINL